MAKLKLTTATVAKLAAPDPSGRQVLHWDQDLTGFGVMTSGKTAAKTYIVQRDVAGRTRRVTIGPTNVLSLPEARKRAVEVLAGLYQGVDPKQRAKSNPTLAAVLADYLEARASLRPASRRDYRVHVENYLAPWLDLPFRQITPEMVEARHRAIQKDIQAKGQYSGAAAANMAMRTLRVLWNWAADRDQTLGPNPVRRLKRAWFPVPQRTRYIKAEQLPAFYRAVMELPNPVHRDFLLLLLFAGFRLFEAGSLTWESIDLHERVIRVPGGRTKSGRKLDLPMSDVVFGIFLERQRLGRERFVFPANTSTRHVMDVHHPLIQVAIATGIKISAHDLRRTFVTVAESTDISPIALKALVNHSLGSDITGGYVQMTVERLREPAQKVADRLKSLCGIEAPEGVAKLSFTKQS
jgi:integrase